MSSDRPLPEEPIEEQLDSQTVALRIVAGLLIAGAAYLLASLLVPFALALVVAIALSPVAAWLERRAGLPSWASALSCTGLVALFLATILGLIAYQAGTILQQTDQYTERFGGLLADLANRTGGQDVLESLGMVQPGDSATSSGDGGAGETGAADAPRPEPAAAPVEYTETLRRNLQTVGRWLVSGIGGLLGFLGGLVIFLAYIYYMLSTRAEWIDRLRRTFGRLDLRMNRSVLDQIRGQLVTYLGYLALVSACYVVVISLALWAIGVPQPLLWGILTGLLEVVPYFGPIIATAMPTVVSLSLGTWWQPLAVLGLFVLLQAVEGYIIAPMLYGGAVRINPVTVIFGLLFFGWLWGPIGLMTAMPMMILLRGLVTMSPDTPALDALVGEEGKESPAGSDR